MMYTFAEPGLRSERIHLYPSVDAALAVRGEGRCVFAVAISYDAHCRRVLPLWTDPEAFDPTWAAPVECHADGTITAKGPIPQVLFAVLVPSSTGPSEIPP